MAARSRGAAARKRRVVFGLYGSTLDRASGRRRWERWRPSVAVCRHAELPIDRFEFLFNTRHKRDALNVVRDMEKSSPATEVVPSELTIQDPWDLEEVYSCFHSFLAGYPFEPEREEYLVHMTTGSHIMQICWFLLCESRHLPGRLLQSGPPSEGPRSEPGSFAVIDLDLSRYDRLARRFEQERKQGVFSLKSGIETRNADFNRLIESVEKVATRSSEPMLLMGPTGAGKSQLASRIYELKKSKGQCRGPLVVVNCATIRGDGAMSALFGHVKGAYTGAVTARAGLLKSAEGGVLFLDEIGELGADEQAMLLRAIEDKTFLPVGSEREVSSDFQLIAGTNVSLKAAVAEGGFREDLFARINLWSFTLPGLSERREDIAPNLEFELQRCTRKLGSKVTINTEARQRFLNFALSAEATWSANFRDLSAAVLRMATLAPASRIDEETVEEELSRLREGWAPPVPHAAAKESEGAEPLHLPFRSRLRKEDWDELDPFDQSQLNYVLEVCSSSSSLSDAGRRLFSVSRTKRRSKNDADRLRKYLARFGLAYESL